MKTIFKNRNFCLGFAKTVLVLMALLVSSQSFAQTKKKKDYFDWGNLGIGYSDTNLYSDFTGWSYGFNYNRTIGKMFLQGGLNGQLTTFAKTASLTGLYFAPGYGIGLKSRFITALSIGPSYMLGGKKNGDPYKTLGAVGIIQLIPKFADDIGIGVELFVNLNQYVNNAGIRVVVHISKKPKPE